MPEERHDQGVGVIGPRKLHVVGFEVGGNALQDELTGVGVFAFVPLERHVRQAEPHERCERDHQHDHEHRRVPHDHLGDASRAPDALWALLGARNSGMNGATQGWAASGHPVLIAD